MKRGISRHVKVLQPTTNCDYKMEGLVFSLGLTVVKGGLKIRTRDLINVWKDIDQYQDLDIGQSHEMINTKGEKRNAKTKSLRKKNSFRLFLQNCKKKVKLLL